MEVAPEGLLWLLLHAGKGLRVKCKLVFMQKVRVCAASNVLKVKVCDVLHVVEYGGLESSGNAN